MVAQRQERLKEIGHSRNEVQVRILPLSID